MFTSVNTSVYRCKHGFECTAVAIAPAKYCGGKSGSDTPFCAAAVAVTARLWPAGIRRASSVCLASPSAATHPPTRGRGGLSRVPLPWRFVSRPRASRVAAGCVSLSPPAASCSGRGRPSARRSACHPLWGRRFAARGCGGWPFVRSCGRLLPPRPARAALSRKLGSANAVELTQL